MTALVYIWLELTYSEFDCLYQKDIEIKVLSAGAVDVWLIAQELPETSHISLVFVGKQVC
jgi:hypothetical protein